jgi:hypothetical protein
VATRSEGRISQDRTAATRLLRCEFPLELWLMIP